MSNFNHKKAVQALNLLAVWRGGAINKMLALKLIWLADRLHLRKYGRPIVGDKYIAMGNGPVPSKTRDLLQNNAIPFKPGTLDYAVEFLQSTQYDYKSIKETVSIVFSKSDLEALTAVFAAYGNLHKYALRDLSHEFPEWSKWEKGFKENQYKSHAMDYKDFFESAGDKHPLFKDDDEILKLVERLYLREDKAL
jgi:uncharacterized phage-associated protein